MNEEFYGHQNEHEDANDNGDSTCASVDPDGSVEDREEEAIACKYFDGSPCSALGPKKGPCWIRAGHSCKVGGRAWHYRNKK